MNIKSLFHLSLLCIVVSGCRLTNALVRTTIVEPLQYARNVEQRCERGRFQELAEFALAESEARARAELDNYSCDPFSADRKCGFIDGFVDYLDAGGTGSPPPLPPRRYWRAKYENPAGECAVQDWYHGYAQGAAAAQASGFRKMVLVWPSDSIVASREPYYAGQNLMCEAEHETKPAAPVDEQQPSRLVIQSKEPLPEASSDNQTAAVEQRAATNLPEMWRADPKSLNAEKAAEPLMVTANSEPQMPTADPEPAIAASSATRSSVPLATETTPKATDIRNTFENGQQHGAVSAASQQTHRTETALGSNAINPTALTPGTVTKPPFSLKTLAPVKPLRPTADSAPTPEVTHPMPERLPAPPVPAQSNIVKPPLRLPPVAHIQRAQPHDIRSASLPETRVTMASRDVVDLPQLDEPPHPDSTVMSTPALNSTMACSDVGQPLRRLDSFDLAATSDLCSQCTENSAVPGRDGESRSPVPRTGSFPAVIREATSEVGPDAHVRRIVRVAIVFLLTAGTTILLGWRWSQRPRQRAFGENKPEKVSKQSRCERRPGVILPGPQATVLAILASCLLTGCASLTNPVLNGIPARRLPPELLAGPRREGLQTIPLSLMRQEVPESYQLAAGDVLGVFIPGVFPLTLDDQALPTPPVYFPSNVDPLGAGLPPSLGYPLTVRSDGTLALPLVDRISVAGLSVEEANDKIRDTFLEKGLLQPGRESVLVTLLQPRRIRVLLFRQEVGGFAAGGRGDIATSNIKQGTSHVIDLRAYENDVLNALAYTGGLPGLDAFDGIYIFRGGQANAELQRRLATRDCHEKLCIDDLNVETIHIPTRWPTCEPLPFEPSDVVLNAGDVVLIEARSEDYFYTGGLLPAGEQRLPRDYDLDVVEAVAQVRGTLVNGAFGGSNFTGRLIQEGVGNPNPSALTVIRRTPNGGQFPISVDLNRALRDPRERILVQAGDMLILQETSGEAIARFFNDIFSFSFAAQVIDRGSANGTLGVTQLR